MQAIIDLIEDNYFLKTRIDGIQNLINCYNLSIFFPWVMLILLLNRKNLKRPVIIVLIVHWILRSTGDAFRSIMDIRGFFDPNSYWPYSQTNWRVSHAFANVFWLTGEIIGDWYPLLRTKAVTTNKKKLRLVYVTCILYNAVKVFGIYCYFIPVDLRIHDEKGQPIRDIVRHRITWWSTVTAMQMASFLYDLSVIYALKTCLFNKLNHYKNFSKNTFLDKFKQISEFRIFLSMIASMILLPFLVGFVVFLMLEYRKETTVYSVPSDSGIEQLRQVVLNFNYNLMYIDQILLRCFADRKFKTMNSSSSKLTYTTKSVYNNNNNNSHNNNAYSLFSTNKRIENSQTVSIDKTYDFLGSSLSLSKNPLISPKSMTSPTSTDYSTLYNDSSMNFSAHLASTPYSNNNYPSHPSPSHSGSHPSDNDLSYELNIINEYPTLSKTSNRESTSPQNPRKSSQVSNIKLYDDDYYSLLNNGYTDSTKPSKTYYDNLNYYS